MAANHNALNLTQTLGKHNALFRVRITEAIQQGDAVAVNLLKTLIKSSHDPLLTQKDKEGRALIHIAAQHHRLETLKYLIETLKVNPTMKSNQASCVCPRDFAYKYGTKISTNNRQTLTPEHQRVYEYLNKAQNDLETKEVEERAAIWASIRKLPQHATAAAKPNKASHPQFDNHNKKNQKIAEGIEKETAEDTWLFKLSKENKEFFMLGTIHDLPLSRFPSCVRDRVNATKTLISESYNTKSAMEDLKELITRFDGFEKAGASSYERFDKEHRTMLEGVLKTYAPEAIKLLPKLKSWLIYAMITHFEGGEEQLNGIDSEVQNDFIERQEKGRGILIGLETTVDVILAYGTNTLTLEECLKKLNEKQRTKLDAEKGKKELETYLSGNVAKMIAMDLGDDPSYLSPENPVNKRNVAWMKKLLQEKLLQQPAPVLVKVGAAHLYSGDRGLLSSFAREGYKIERCTKLGQWKQFNIQKEIELGKKVGNKK